MHFGFSYVGAGMLLLLFIPNFLWARRKPQGYDGYAAEENRVLLYLERIGQVLVTGLSLSFSDFNIERIGLWSLWLLAAFVCMGLYMLYWLRYFRSEKTMQDLYAGFCGVPLAGATLPILAFLLLSVYGRNPLLALAVLLLGIGHIGIHIQHKKQLERKEE